MDDIILAIAVSFMAFVSTSMDNLFLLVTLSLHPKYGIARVRIGYLIAVLIMLGICLIFAQGVQQLPVDYIPYIGLVPLGIGLYELYQLIRGKKPETAGNPEIPDAKRGTFWTVALIMIAHSWDSIGVLAPLLSDTRPGLVSWMAISVVAAASLLTLVAQRAVAHPKIRIQLERFAPKILPFLLIGVGLYILTNTSTDVTI